MHASLSAPGFHVVTPPQATSSFTYLSVAQLRRQKITLQSRGSNRLEVPRAHSNLDSHLRGKRAWIFLPRGDPGMCTGGHLFTCIKYTCLHGTRSHLQEVRLAKAWAAGDPSASQASHALSRCGQGHQQCAQGCLLPAREQRAPVQAAGFSVLCGVRPSTRPLSGDGLVGLSPRSHE